MLPSGLCEQVVSTAGPVSRADASADFSKPLAEALILKCQEELAVTKARDWTAEDPERVRADKAAKQGGFEKKIPLKEVWEN